VFADFLISYLNFIIRWFRTSWCQGLSKSPPTWSAAACSSVSSHPSSSLLACLRRLNAISIWNKQITSAPTSVKKWIPQLSLRRGFHLWLECEGSNPGKLSAGDDAKENHGKKRGIPGRFTDATPAVTNTTMFNSLLLHCKHTLVGTKPWKEQSWSLVTFHGTKADNFTARCLNKNCCRYVSAACNLMLCRAELACSSENKRFSEAGNEL